MSDMVHLTYGVTMLLSDRVSLAAAVAHPITGPQVFDWEFQLQLNVFFGGPASPVPSAPGLL